MGKEKQYTAPTPKDTESLESKREIDLLWTGDRTIKESYLEIYSLYSKLADTMEDFVSGLPEGGLNIADKYTETRHYSRIVADYYKRKADRVEVDGKLKDRINSPGWETLVVLNSLPKEIQDEIKADLLEGDSPTYGTAISILREFSKTIQDYLPTLAPEETESSLFPQPPSMEGKEDFILQDKISILRILQLTKRLERGVRIAKERVSPKLRKRCEEYSNTTDTIIESLSRYIETPKEDVSLEYAKLQYYNSRRLGLAMTDLLAETDQLYKIVEVDGDLRVIEYKSDQPTTAIEALQELSKIEKKAKAGRIPIPKDLLETEIISRGDSFSIIRENNYLTDKEKKDSIQRIQKLQKQGKLLRGTLEGLAGGTASFKIFTIALSQTLNEQIKYYRTEAGLPIDLARKYIGADVELETEREIPLYKGGELVKQENRSYPYILISYKDLAKKIKGVDKITGGKDIKEVRDYIGTLLEKEYLIPDGKGGIIGLPFIHREASLYLEKGGDEVGCVLRLSPQFSKTVRGYSSLRADTIKLLGREKKKEITMNLLDVLIYYRGVNEGIFKKKKEDLLSQIATGKTYQTRKKDRETDFQEAIQKAKDSQIIINYKEVKNPGGEIISVFYFNPDYFKGVDIPESQE